MGKAELESAIAALETWIQLFGILVAIGIVGEVGVGVRHWILNRRLQAVQRSEDIERVTEIARLNKEAGDARKAAGEAVERAAEANKRTEDERLARVKLEEFLNWRRVSPKQKESIRMALALLDPAITVAVLSDMRDPESAQFALDLLEVFKKLGDVSGRGVGNVMSPPSRFGLWIDTFDPSESAARSVESVLTRNGIKVTGIRIKDGSTLHSEEDRKAAYPKLDLFVGFRPTPLNSAPKP